MFTTVTSLGFHFPTVFKSKLKEMIIHVHSFENKQINHGTRYLYIIYIVDICLFVTFSAL